MVDRIKPFSVHVYTLILQCSFKLIFYVIFPSGHEGLGQFYYGLISPTLLVNFTAVLQPDIVANSSQCYLQDCHAIVGRSVEITTTLPVPLLPPVVVKVCGFQCKPPA